MSVLPCWGRTHSTRVFRLPSCNTIFLLTYILSYRQTTEVAKPALYIAFFFCIHRFWYTSKRKPAWFYNSYQPETHPTHIQPLLEMHTQAQCHHHTPECTFIFLHHTQTWDSPWCRVTLLLQMLFHRNRYTPPTCLCASSAHWFCRYRALRHSFS